MIKGKDYVGVTVVYFCHDDKGRFLMAKRSQQARDEQGRWDIGGGSLDFGLTIEATLRKEIKEEYLTDLFSYQFLGYRDVHRVHDDCPTHWVALDFKVLVDSAQVGLGEPHKFDEIGWFTLATLPDKLHSQLPNFLERYADQFKLFTGSAE